MKRIVLSLSLLLSGITLLAQPDLEALESKYEEIVGNSFRQGKMEEAAEQFGRLMKEAERAGHKELQMYIASTMGVVCSRRGLPDSALVYYSQALDIAIETGDKSNESNITLNIATLYGNQKRVDEALPFVERSVASARESEYPEDLILALETKGALEIVADRLTDAVLTLEESMDKASTFPEDDPDMKARLVIRSATALLGCLTRMEGKDADIRRCLSQASPYLGRIPDGSVEYSGYREALAQVDIKMGNYQEAADIFEERLASKTNRSAPDHHYRRWLGRAYAGMHRWEDAYRMMERGYIELDSLSKEDIQAQLSEFSVKYETQQKELEIAQLKKEEAERKALIAGLLAGLALLASGFVVLLLLRKRQKAQAELSRAKEYIDGLESERSRLAKELHDGIANDLLGLEMNLRSKGTESQDTAESIAELRESVRSVSHNLIPPQLEYADLNELLDETLQRFRVDSVRIIYEADPSEGWDELPAETALGLYRAAQELVGNALRHSGADIIRVSLGRKERQLRLCVSDNGTPVEATPGKGGIGSRTLEDRMRLLGAHLEYFRDDDGTRAVITMDL